MGIQHVSQTGLNLIKSFEGCRLVAYKCPAGVWTIGYGHTAGVYEGMKITQAQAEDLLRTDLERYESPVRKYDSKYNWNQNQFDALTSFTYNCGAGNLNKLLSKGTRSIQEIANALPQFNKGGGKVLAGLVRRRAAEKELFLKGLSTVSTVPPIQVTTSTLKANQTVRGVQNWLNNTYQAGIVEDNSFGPKTLRALIMAWQKEDGTLKVDGSFGPLSQNKASAHNIKQYSKGIFVTIWQAYLVCKGYDPKGIDGSFGSGCYKATTQYQSDNNLTPDGVVGKATWTKAFR